MCHWKIAKKTNLACVFYAVQRGDADNRGERQFYTNYYETKTLLHLASDRLEPPSRSLRAPQTPYWKPL